MRTAEEYINEMLRVNGYYTKEIIAFAINEARRECIDECAEAAKVTDPYQQGCKVGLRDNWLKSYIENNPPIVDKQSILKLKDQIK